MNLDNRLFILGAVFVSCVLYQLSLYLSLLVLAVAAVVLFVRSALSAHKNQPSGPDLSLKYQHARFGRRRIVSNVPRRLPAVDNNLYKSCTVTPSYPWTNTRATTPLITHQAVKVSPLISTSFSHESPVKRCSSRGFATQVVSTAFHNKSPSHQSHYTGLGVFPTVHLQKASLPLLSQRNSNMVHRPVTVKIAPLEKCEIPAPRLDFTINSSEQRKTPSVDSVVSALKSRRKRSFRNVTEEELDGESKRQKRDSSSNSGSAFKSLSPSPSNVLNGMLRSTSSLLLQQQTPKINLSATESQKRTNLTSVSSSGVKNNAIFSSYSSTNRVRAKQGLKRSRHKRLESPSNKISKLDRQTLEDVFSSITTTTKSSPITSKSPTLIVKTLSPSYKSTDENSMAIQPISSPEDKISDKTVATTSSLREGFSWKRQMPVYTSIYHTKSKPFYIPQCDDTVEGDQRDQQRNQIKLQNLLGCVSETFRAIDVSQNKNTDFAVPASTSKPADVIKTSLPSAASVESFASPTTTTTSLPLNSLPSSVSSVPFSNWVTTVDTTTTTSTLTTVSSTGVGGQEVEKIHEQSAVQFSSPQKVEKALAAADVVSSTSTLEFSAPKANAFAPLLTSANNSFASTASTTSSSFASLFTSPTTTSANGSSNLAISSFPPLVPSSALSTSSNFALTTPGSQSQAQLVFGSVTTSSLTSPANTTTSSSSFTASGSMFQIGQNNGAKSSFNSDALTTGKTPSLNPFAIGGTHTIPPVPFSSLTSFQQPSSSLFKFDTPVSTNDKKSEAPTSTTSTFQFGTGSNSFKSPSSFNPSGFNFQTNSTSSVGGAGIGGGSNATPVKESLNAPTPFFGGVTPASTAGSGFTFGSGQNASSSMTFGQAPSGPSFAATSPSTTPSFPTFNGPTSFQFGSNASSSSPFVFGPPATTTGGLNFSFNPEPTIGSSSRRLTYARRRNARPH